MIMNSALLEGAVAEWEQELRTCPHTREMIQVKESRHLEKKALAHCNDCQLSSNLWLCLICGNLGCGRKNYDGSGGNNHGVHHYTNTHHPISVKIGTVTPEGSACMLYLFSFFIFCFFYFLN